MMTALCSYDLQRPDAMIRYWTGGVDEAPVVVFLHGATLDYRAWHPQIDALGRGFRVVAPDLRGHGSSTGRFDFDAAVEDVLALLDHLACPPVVLVGLSLGANIAQEVLRRRADLVRALVAADTTCNNATATRWPPRVPSPPVEILTSLLTTALRTDPAYRLPAPALLVHGQRDHVGDIVTDMRAWARREPSATYAVIPGAGHASKLDNPVVFTELLVGFINDLPSPAHSTAAGL